MSIHNHAKGSALRAAIVGLLLAFSFFILKALVDDPAALVGALVAIAVAVLLARKTSAHFHRGHTHLGDSPVDAVAVTVLFLANILHPAVDGFSWYEIATREGTTAGLIVGGGIVVHEFFRQSALIAAFRSMGLTWIWVVVTGVCGIALGIGAGVVGTEVFHRHENIIDIATIFAYAFIISEFYIADRRVVKGATLFIALGLLLGTVLAVFVRTH